MDDEPRPADMAVTISVMQEELFRLIWETGYRQPNNHHPGADAELMRVSRLTAVATRRGRELTITDIAKELAMPQSNVKRHLRQLVRAGRVKRLDGRYVRYLHDLDALDELMKKSRANIEEAMAIIDRCQRECQRLLPLLAHQLAIVFVAIGPYLSRLARVSPLIT